MISCLGPFAGSNENGNTFRLVCYYGSWSHWRTSIGRLPATDINPFLCTHLIYSFLRIDADNFSVSSNDPYLDLEGGTQVGAYNKFLALKHKNPELKVMISVGGWDAGSQVFSNMSLTPSSRKIFIRSLLQFLDKYPFDGVDIDWEYPAQRDGRPQDRRNFLSLMKELRSAFDQRDKKMILSAAVAATKYIADKSYDIPALNHLLDFVNIMTYDYFGPWTAVVGHNSPLFHRKQAKFENADLSVNASIIHWMAKGMDRRKIQMGIPMYGRTFTLKNASDYEPFAVSAGDGIQGNVSQIQGVLSHYEACQLEKEKGTSMFWAKDWQAPFLVRGDQWISYENSRSVRAKADFIRDHGLAGAMIWSLDHDDVTGVCGEGRMPLTSVVSQRLGISENWRTDWKQGSDRESEEGSVLVREEEEVADSDVKPRTGVPARILTVSSTAASSSPSRAVRVLLITLLNSTYLIRRND